MSLILSTAYAPPIYYMALLYKYRHEAIFIEANEHIVKQSWRNRCDVISSNGVQSLTIPIERPLGGKTPIKDVLISHHGSWKHQHKQALQTNYGSSPFFEFLWDDIAFVYDKNYRFLWDFNIDMLDTLLRILHLDIRLEETKSFVPLQQFALDYRYCLHPRRLSRELLYDYPKYYQGFSSQVGFTPELSIYDLLFNLGNESLIYLRDYPLEQISGYLKNPS